LQAAAILIACYGTIAIYRIPFAISSVFIVIASHQLVAPLGKLNIQNGDDDLKKLTVF